MIPKICAVALMCALLSAFLGELGFKNKKLISLLAVILLFGAMSEGIGVFIEKITKLSESAGLSDACLTALKAVGLGYVFGITSDVCSELGETGVARAVTVAGKVEILLVSLPYFEKTINLGLELLK